MIMREIPLVIVPLEQDSTVTILEPGGIYLKNIFPAGK
jgi:hypothetical protein